MRRSAVSHRVVSRPRLQWVAGREPSCIEVSGHGGRITPRPVLRRGGVRVRDLKALLPRRVDRCQGDEALAVGCFEFGQGVGKSRADGGNRRAQAHQTAVLMRTISAMGRGSFSSSSSFKQRPAGARCCHSCPRLRSAVGLGQIDGVRARDEFVRGEVLPLAEVFPAGVQRARGSHYGNRYGPAHVRGNFGHPPAAPVCAA